MAVSQPVRVFRQGNFWAVEPLDQWTTVDARVMGRRPNSILPALTYTAHVEDFTIEVDYQYLLSVDNEVYSDSLFGSSYQLDTVPRPNALFTDYYRSAGGRAWEGEEEVSLTVWYQSLNQNEAFPTEFGHSSFRTPEAHGLGGGGGSDHNGCDQQQSPAAIAVKFRYDGRDYTGIAWPEEVAYD